MENMRPPTEDRHIWKFHALEGALREERDFLREALQVAMHAANGGCIFRDEIVQWVEEARRALGDREDRTPAR